MCERALGQSVQWHHTVPKSKRGRETVPVHPICHRTIHANFSNTELARIGTDRTRIASDERMTTFLHWIAGKPPDFHAPTRTSR
ncbi:HNH endonuclease [Qipengyuania atrilutea]|uniref:HNH endonuclease n=1 Tax=Qipengyuania atrilutea TaxID=2744473 RepID=UPI001CED91FD